MPTPFWELIRFDIWMGIAIFGGIVARLCDKQERSFKQSVKQFFYSLCVGAALSALFVASTSFVKAIHVVGGFFLTLLASLIVEVVEKKLVDLADTHLTEWLKTVGSMVFDEIKAYLPFLKKSTLPVNSDLPKP